MNDMNNLTQSVGNAASSVTNLFQVRTSIESQRIASEIQKANYDFIQRTKLIPGDPNRIVANNDGTGVYWRDALDEHNGKVSDLINSTKWGSVKGAVSRAVEPISQQFGIQQADAYAGQEIAAAQSDWMVSKQNIASTIDSPEKLDQFLADADNENKTIGLFDTVSWNNQVKPSLDAMAASSLYNLSVNSPRVITPAQSDSEVAKSSGYTKMVEALGIEQAAFVASAPEGTEAITAPADYDSAKKYIMDSKYSASQKRQAIAALEEQSKGQTEQFNDMVKALVTDREESGTVDVDAVFNMIQNSGLVNTSARNAAISKLMGYETKKFGAELDSISGSYYSAHSENERSALVAAAQKEVRDLVASKPSYWAQSEAGQKIIEAKQQEIASWELKEGADSAADQTYRLFGDLAAIKNANDLGANPVNLMFMVQGTENEAKRIGETMGYTSAYPSFVNQAADVHKALAERFGDENKLDMANRTTNVLLGYLSKDQQKQVYEALKDPKKMDPDMAVFMDSFGKDVLATLSRDDLKTDKERDAVLMQLATKYKGKDLWKQMTTAPAEKSKEGVFGNTALNDGGKILKEVVSGNTEYGRKDTLSGEFRLTPSVAPKLEQLSQSGGQLLKEMYGFTPVINMQTKSGLPETTLPARDGKPPVLLTMTQIEDNGKNRPVWKGSDGSIIYFDKQPSQAEREVADAAATAKKAAELKLSYQQGQAAQAAAKITRPTSAK